MRKMLISTGLSAVLALGACGGSETDARAASEAGTQASAEAPLFTTVGLEDLRAAGGAQLRESLGFLREECGSAPVGFEDGAVRSADFNGDGRPDFLIDMTGFTCGGENRGDGWCGSGGCSFDVFVSTGDDFHLDSFMGMEPGIVRVGDRPGVSAQGRDGPWTVAWDGEAMNLVEEAGPQATGAGDEAAIRAVVASIYDPYVAGFDSGAEIPSDVETQGLRDAIQAAIDPEMGALGFDYYCGCQDYGDVSYTIRSVSVSGDTAVAALDFSNLGNPPQRIQLDMRRSGGRWRVDDVRDSHGSLRASLAEY